MANLNVSQNTLSITAEVVFNSDGRRCRATVRNIDASIPVYISDDPALTSSTGFKLDAGDAYTFEGFSAMGPISAIAASGTPTVCLIEEYS